MSDEDKRALNSPTENSDKTAVSLAERYFPSVSPLCAFSSDSTDSPIAFAERQSESLGARVESDAFVEAKAPTLSLNSAKEAPPLESALEASPRFALADSELRESFAALSKLSHDNAELLKELCGRVKRLDAQNFDIVEFVGKLKDDVEALKAGARRHPYTESVAPRPTAQPTPNTSTLTTSQPPTQRGPNGTLVNVYTHYPANWSSQTRVAPPYRLSEPANIPRAPYPQPSYRPNPPTDGGYRPYAHPPNAALGAPHFRNSFRLEHNSSLSASCRAPQPIHQSTFTANHSLHSVFAAPQFARTFDANARQ